MEDLFEVLESAVVATDGLGTITIFNPAATKLFGYAKSEAIGQDCVMLMPQSYRPSHAGWMKTYATTGKKKLIGKPRVVPAQRKDGQIVRVEISLSSRAQTASGTQEMYYAVFRPMADISKPLAGADAFEALIIPVVVSDSKGEIRSFNDSAVIFFGYKKEEAVGQNVSLLMPSPHREMHDQYIDNYNTTGKTKIMGRPRRLNAQTKSGAIVAVEIRLNRSEDDEGNTLFYATFSEVTDTGTSSGEFSMSDSSLSSRSHVGSSSVDMKERIRTLSLENTEQVEGVKAISKKLRPEHVGPLPKTSSQRLDDDMSCSSWNQTPGAQKLSTGQSTSDTATTASSAERELQARIAALEAKLEEEREIRKELESNFRGLESKSHRQISPSELQMKRKIGEGGYAKVYVALWLGKEVAVKKLFRALNKQVTDAFFKEVNLLAKLHHPNIVLMMGIADLGSPEKPQYALVTEYMAGGSLFDHLEDLNDNDKRMDEKLLLSIAKDIACGLNYLHKQDPPIIHRDLKSLNILLDEYQRAKVADFGLSRHSANTMTRSMGTPHWMAPEALQGAQHYTDKVDVYAYGVLLWEMWTCKTPFEQFEPFQLITALVQDPNVRPEMDDTIPPRWKELIEECWQTDPDKRPHVEQVLEKLTSFAEG